MLFILPLRKQGHAGIPLLTLLVCVACLVVYSATTSEAAKLSLAYYPNNPTFVATLTSAFVHGDIFHLLGNLFFFYCFAGALERDITVKAYAIGFLLFAFASDLAYSTYAKGGVPTVGLSGVVYGFMGMLLVRHPTGKIDCVAWYLWVIRRIDVPTFVFVISFLVFDIGALRHGAGEGVNYVAHIAGCLAGVFLMLFFRGAMEKQREPTRPSRASNVKQPRSKIR